MTTTTNLSHQSCYVGIEGPTCGLAWFRQRLSPVHSGGASVGYYSTSLVTKKSDVYSFGVVLFELITGHSPMFTESGKRLHIVEWVSPRLAKGDIHGVADPKLSRQYNVNSMWKVADIAMSCTSQPHHSRPHMSNVVDQLKKAIELENNYQHRTDTSFTEVELSSSSPYEFSSSSLSSSHPPPAQPDSLPPNVLTYEAIQQTDEGEELNVFFNNRWQRQLKG
ncbi:hypothetical protein EJ110_NYTH58911 [Nymphaea thermarum]|nr:hypothetical protein EJ110_NYTH58911 [Nymphaea thermarum]